MINIKKKLRLWISIIISIITFFSFNTVVNALENGSYKISSAINSGKVMDLSGGKVGLGRNIQLYDYNNTNAQTWVIQRDDTGYYTIASGVDNSYVLDVSGSVFNNASNIQLYKRNGSKAQKFQVEEDESGYYTIFSYDHTYVIDITGGKQRNGTNIQLYKRNGSKSQKFLINKVAIGNRNIEDGIYTISTSFSKLVTIENNNMSNNSNINISDNKDNNYQKWYIKYLNNGYYSIKSLANTKYSFDVAGGAKVRNTNIQLYESNGSDAQQFVLHDNGNSTYKIISKISGMYFSIVDENILLDNQKDDSSQCFVLNKISNFSNYLDNGKYRISSALNSAKSLDLYGGKALSGGNIQLYDYNNTNAQNWILEKGNDGYYTIASAVDNNYVLDVSGGAFKNYSNIQVYKRNGSIAQKFQIIQDEKGYYTIFSYDYNYVIDIFGGQKTNGANVQLYRSNSSIAQKFIINEIVDGNRSIEDGVYTIGNQENKLLNIEQNKVSSGTNINLLENNNTNSQKWYIKYLNNGYYSINSLSNMRYSLDVSGAYKLRFANIQLYMSNNSDAQQFVIRDNGNSTYKIISKISGLYFSSNNGNVLLDINSNSNSFSLNKINDFGVHTVDDGYYFINSKINIKKSFDVTSGVIKENSNVQLYDSNSTIAQKWLIKYIDNGYYKILCNGDNNLALTSNKGNISINTYNNLESQQWIIMNDENGYFTIVNKKLETISIEKGTLKNGTNIKVSQIKPDNYQQFKLILTADGISKRVLDDGYYFINIYNNENVVFDLTAASLKNGTNIQLYQKNSTKAQKWYIKYISNGYYIISSSLNQNKVFHINNKKNLILTDYNNNYQEQFLIKDAGNGYFNIISNSDGNYLDVSNNNINLSKYNGNELQKFKFSKTRYENLVADISSWNGKINWDALKESGIYGVILRVSAGCEKEDATLAYNISEVKRLGIPYGVYIYSYAENYSEGEQYATFMKNIISKYNMNPTLGIYLDLETSNINAYMGVAEYTNVVIGFMSVLPNAKIYTYKNYADTALKSEFIWSYIAWIAQWSLECTFMGDYKIWQFTNNGSLPGINGRVDLNYYYFD